MPTTPVLPDVTEDRSAAQLILEQVESTAIATPAQRELVFRAHASAREIEKAIEEKFKIPKRGLDAVKKWVLDAEKEALAFPQRVKALATEKLRTYDEEQDRIRREKEREAREAALKAEEERRMREAETVRATDGEAAAMSVLDEPIAPPVVVLPETNVRAEGEVRTVRWKARIVDPMKVPREWCVPNETAINSHARNTKGQIPIPGCEFYSERDYSSRSAR